MWGRLLCRIGMHKRLIGLNHYFCARGGCYWHREQRF